MKYIWKVIMPIIIIALIFIGLSVYNWSMKKYSLGIGLPDTPQEEPFTTEDSTSNTDTEQTKIKEDLPVTDTITNTNTTNAIASWKNFQKPSDETLEATLTPIQYKVTQEEGTEGRFENEYWNNHEEGIYVDIVSGEPLFSSTDKYDSGTGWPSFLKPIDPSFVTEHDDYKLFTKRTEIRSKIADSHLGHIILDGPEENNKIRYCMNSAALRFIPKEELESQGYGEFGYLFTEL